MVMLGDLMEAVNPALGKIGRSLEVRVAGESVPRQPTEHLFQTVEQEALWGAHNLEEDFPTELRVAVIVADRQALRTDLPFHFQVFVRPLRKPATYPPTAYKGSNGEPVDACGDHGGGQRAPRAADVEVSRSHQ